ncbi:phage tail tape measure protein [Streptomyces violaceusniger]|uniref:phage tail tape measure protein n=1 Tax=Streptomyces violaceusniger TaxID=68280 RepID=UPI003825C4D7
MASDTSLVFNLIARDQASGRLAAMKEKFAAASAAIGTGVAAALGIGVAANMDMSAANAKLSAQLGVGPTKAAELSKVSARIYGNAWGDSTATVNDAIKGVYQNIGNTKDAKGGLEGVTTKVLALSQTFDQDLGGTTAAVGQMIKTGLARNADEALDILTRGFQSGANKADDLLDTMNEYGTQFRKFGIDGKMATGLLTQGLKGGARDADLVADAIKEFSIRAIDGSTTTAQGFKSIGLNAGQMAAQIGKGGSSANKALDLTLDKLRGIHDPVKREAAAVALFGTQAEDLGKSLYSLDPSSAVQALGKVSDAADKMTKTVGESPAAAMERFKRQATMKLAEVSGSFISFAMQNQGVFKPLAVVLGLVAAAVVSVTVAQKLYATYTAIAGAATTLFTAETWALTAAWLANPMTWVVIGITALVAAIVLIATKTNWFQRLWSAAWSGMKRAIGSLFSWVKAHWPLLLSILTGPIGAAVIYIARHWDQIKSKTVSTFTSVVNWVRGVPGKIYGAVSGLASGLYGRARNAWGQFKSGTTSAASSAVSWVRGLPGKIRNALGSLGGLLYGSGKAIIRGLINGIKAMAGSVKDAVSGVLSKARNLLPFSPAKEGPFAGKGWTLYSGQSMMTSLAQGITSKSDDPKQAMRSALAYTSPASAAGGIGAQSIFRGGVGMRPTQANLIVDGRVLASILIDHLRGEIQHISGGNVQRALGRG